MARFSRGDRVYMRDREPPSLETPHRERLATVLEEQVVGPFTDLVSMWTRALRINRAAPLPLDIDVIRVNWPEWLGGKYGRD